MKKNDYFKAECIDYTHDGLGVVKVDGYPVFVKNMIKGEIGEIKIVKALKSYAVGRLISLEKKSPNRCGARCDIYKQCGGCHLQHIKKEGQQDFKTNRVKDVLKRIGNIEIDVEPCIMMDTPWFYRNKVQVPVGYQDKKLVTGFYKAHSNEIIPFDTCYIQNDESNKLVHRVRELLDQSGEFAYNKVSHRGNIRHILVKSGEATQEMMLVLITQFNKINNIDFIVETLIKEFPNLKTIVHNINKDHDNVILGKYINILYGEGYIEDVLLGNTYRISTYSFYQVNPHQVETLYSKAIEYAELKETDVVIDAYCGIGTISLSIANQVKQVYGVDIVKPAIEDAKANAKRNNINNVEFICDDAGEYMVKVAKEGKAIDVVVVDPPRKGCSELFLEQLVTLSPKRVVYVSCDVSTQARDLKFLQSHGYTIGKCQPVDMFPQSFHVENVVVAYKS